MPAIFIRNADIILRDRVRRRSSVLIDKGRVVSIGRRVAPGGAVDIDASGCYLAPGFIDCHIHGDPTKVFSNEIRHGTTSIVATESCARLGKFYRKARLIASLMNNRRIGRPLLGLRLEGPYISRIKAGAQDKRYIKKPDNKELAAIIRRCGPVLRIMTVAPEEPGALGIIRALEKSGVIASIGHSNAGYGEAKRGLDAGIRHATHVFNAMSRGGLREKGAFEAVLDDARVWAEVILDMIHVPKERFKLLLKKKGPDKIILITDSIKAQPGNKAGRRGGAYRLADGRLAGSSLTMITAVKNAVRRCGMRLPDAVKLATLNPARLMGISKRVGSISAGKDADIVLFDRDFNVKLVMIGGKIVFGYKAKEKSPNQCAE